MIKNGGSGNTIGPRQSTYDIKSLESKTNTELLKAIDDMMALPAEEIDMDFVNACLDLLQDRAPITETYDPQKTLDRLYEEHPALFEIEETPVKATDAETSKPRKGRGTVFRYAGAFAAAVLCLVVTANAFGYNPIQALFRWVNDTIQIYSNPSGLLELPPDDPGEYHSLDEALEANGLESADRITWIPKDYSLANVRVSPRSKTVQVSAIYGAERGELAIRILALNADDWGGKAEGDIEGTPYMHNDVTYYISSNFDITKAGWEDEKYSYVVSGQISEEEVKKMIDSIT